MRHDPSAPLVNLWRRLPRAIAASVDAVAALSPLRALVVLLMTLGFGTSALVSVASVGESYNEAAEQPTLKQRPAATASRDVERPDVPAESGDAPEGSASAPSPSESGRKQSSKAPSPAAASPSRTAGSPPAESQEAPGAASAGPSRSAGPGQSDGEPARGAGDATPPETVLAEWFPDGDEAVFSFRADEPATYSCSLDGAEYTSCDSPESFSRLHPGWHTFSVRATDEAGNVDPSPAEVSWHANAGSGVNHERD